MKKLIIVLILLISGLNLYAQSFSDTNQVQKVKFLSSKKNNIKVNLTFMPVLNITYERAYYNRQVPSSFEIGIAHVNPSLFYFISGSGYGFNLRAGNKFILTNSRKEYLDGFYFKPELFSQYVYKIYNRTNRHKDDYFTLAFVFNGGYQFVFSRRLSLDMSLGIGIAHSNFTDEGGGMFDMDFGMFNLSGYRFGVTKQSSTNISPCMAGSIKLGLAF